jgi:hypothetical protein
VRETADVKRTGSYTGGWSSGNGRLRRTPRRVPEPGPPLKGFTTKARRARGDSDAEHASEPITTLLLFFFVFFVSLRAFVVKPYWVRQGGSVPSVASVV